MNEWMNHDLYFQSVDWSKQQQNYLHCKLKNFQLPQKSQPCPDPCFSSLNPLAFSFSTTLTSKSQTNPLAPGLSPSLLLQVAIPTLRSRSLSCGFNPSNARNFLIPDCKTINKAHSVRVIVICSDSYKDWSNS